MTGVRSSPFARVAKYEPDRSLSADGRFVHDQRVVNLGTCRWDHPPALQPTHPSVAAEVISLKANYPGIPVMMSKTDVKSAFRLVWIDLEGSTEFVTTVPGKPFDIPEELHLVFMVLSFGFGGSPGEYQILAHVVKTYHHGHHPANALWNGGGLTSWFLVDDLVLVEVMIARRPNISKRVSTPPRFSRLSGKK